MLSRHAADIAGGSADGAAVIAAAYGTVAVDTADHAADICTAADACFIAAVLHGTCGELADNPGNVGCAVNHAAHDEIFHRSAVYIGKKADGGGKVTDNMILPVKSPFERGSG